MSPYRADSDLPVVRGGRTEREHFALTPEEHAAAVGLAELAGCESRAAWWRGLLRREARLSGWRLDFAEASEAGDDDSIGSDDDTETWEPLVPRSLPEIP